MHMNDKDRCGEMKPFIYDLNLDDLQEWAKENGEPAFRA